MLITAVYRGDAWYRTEAEGGEGRVQKSREL
jgi:hypothetical protein